MSRSKRFRDVGFLYTVGTFSIREQKVPNRPTYRYALKLEQHTFHLSVRELFDLTEEVDELCEYGDIDYPGAPTPATPSRLQPRVLSTAEMLDLMELLDDMCDLVEDKGHS